VTAAAAVSPVLPIQSRSMDFTRMAGTPEARARWQATWAWAEQPQAPSRRISTDVMRRRVG
jgi:hypothetical protein